MLGGALPHSSESRPRRGAAMIEMVLVIPFLAFMIGVIYFFGWAMMHQQHVKVSDRYASWRAVYGGGTTGDNLNDYFFRNQGTNIELAYEAAPGDTAATYDDYLAAASRMGQMPAGLADRTVVQGNQGFSRGHYTNVAAEFPHRSGVSSLYKGQIRAGAGRQGLEWRRAHANEVAALVDQFLGDVDSAMNGVPGDGNAMGQVVRRLYLDGW